jgi:hypothetical protein
MRPVIKKHMQKYHCFLVVSYLTIVSVVFLQEVHIVLTELETLFKLALKGIA